MNYIAYVTLQKIKFYINRDAAIRASHKQHRLSSLI